MRSRDAHDFSLRAFCQHCCWCGAFSTISFVVTALAVILCQIRAKALTTRGGVFLLTPRIGWGFSSQVQIKGVAVLHPKETRPDRFLPSTPPASKGQNLSGLLSFIYLIYKFGQVRTKMRLLPGDYLLLLAESVRQRERR